MHDLIERPRAVEGEVLAPLTPVVLHDSPFRVKRIDLEMPQGVTVYEAVVAAGLPPAMHHHLTVYVGGHEITREYWPRVRPKAGREIYIRVRLHGSGGGGKNILRSLLLIAVVVTLAVFAPEIVGFYAGATMFGAGIGAGAVTGITAGVIAVGASAAGMLLNALIPPPQAKNQFGFDQSLGSPYAQITGLQNQAAPYGPIPRVLGQRRMFPMLAGRPYTEVSGHTQWLRMLLLVGYGPLKITDLKIGENPIENFVDCESEIREGWCNVPGHPNDDPVTLYSRDIHEDYYSILLQNLNDQAIQTTAINCIEISVDLSFPAGLYYVNNKGSIENHEVDILVEYRIAGSDVVWQEPTWLDYATNPAVYKQQPGLLHCHDSTQSGTFRSGRWSVPAGQYEVRITRQTAAGGTSTGDLCYFTTLRSVLNGSALPSLEGLSLIALRLQATAQLNGVPNQINCVATSYLPVYDPVATTWTYELSRSPAWAYADLLRRRGQETMITDDRIDLPAMVAWDAACAAPSPQTALSLAGTGITDTSADPTNYWNFDGVLEGGSIFTGLQTVASHGRANFTIRDGKYSVVRDVPQTVPVQYITPRNSSNYTGNKGFADIPHCLRVHFSNAVKLYAQDEIRVYQDGYNEDGSDGLIAASKFDVLEMPGCTSASQAWREARYHFGVLLLRNETHTVSMDIENLRCTLGDLVLFQHDTIDVGLGAGRVISITSDGSGNITALGVDNPVVMQAGTSFSVRLRRSDGSSVVLALANDITEGAADVATLYLASPTPPAQVCQTGDLFLFGEPGLESMPCLVKQILPDVDLSAKLVLTPAEPGVWTADSQVIPPFESFITLPLVPTQAAPPQLDFTLTSNSGTAAYATDGTVLERVLVALDAIPSGLVAVASIDVQWQGSGSADWTQLPVLQPGSSGCFISGVLAGADVFVRVRTNSADGVPSDWIAHDVIVAGKTTPPGQITNLTASNNRYDQIEIDYSIPSDGDLWHTEIWASAANDLTTTTQVGISPDPATAFTLSGLGSDAGLFFWARAVNLSGVAGAWSSGNNAGVPGSTVDTISATSADTAAVNGIPSATITKNIADAQDAITALINGESPAAQSALAAEQGALDAEGLAYQYMGQAQGYANSASDSEGLATQAANGAGNSAYQASQSAGSSADSATAASNFSLEAQTTGAATLPSSMAIPGFFTPSEILWPGPQFAADYPGFVTAADGTPVYRNAPEAANTVCSWGNITPIIGRTYQVTATGRIKTAPTNGRPAIFQAGLLGLKSDGTGTTGYFADAPDVSATPVGQLITSTVHEVYGAGVTPQSAYKSRVIINFDGADGDAETGVFSDAVFELISLQLEDVTQAVAAAGSASAAYTSEQSASTSSDSAGASAGEAQTAQGLAVQAQNNAGASAFAAAGSEYSAGVQAGLASGSAQAAAGSALTAQGYSGDAFTYAVDAHGSAVDASGSAVSAADSASLIANYNPGQNLVLNPSGSQGLVGWLQSSTALPFYASPTDPGGPCFVYGNGSAGQQTITCSLYQAREYPVAAEASYSIQVECISGGVQGGTINAGINWHIPGQADQYSVIQPTGNNGAWTRYTLANVISPAGATSATFYLQSDDIPFASLGYLGFRKFKIEAGPICTPYTDDQVGAAIVDASSASASATAAVATRTSTLEATVDGNGTTANPGLSATVMSQAVAIATASGNQEGMLKWGVTAGGEIVGLTLLAQAGDTNIAAIVASCTTFIITTPDGRVLLYADGSTDTVYLQNVVIAGNLLIEGSVDTTQLSPGSVSSASFSVNNNATDVYVSGASATAPTPPSGSGGGSSGGGGGGRTHPN